jgi:flagellar hook-associated protein 1
MDAGLSIAESSLNAQRTAINVTAENVANSKTPGYVRESATITPLPGGDALGVGAGAIVSGIAQAQNALLSANATQATGALASLTSSQQVLTGIENVFPLGQGTSGSSSSASNASIAGQLSSFWSDWDAVNADPTAPAPRSQIIAAAQGLVASLHEAATQLTQLQANAVANLAGTVSATNTLLAQAATLNQRIVTTVGGGGDPAQLRDQLNGVVDQLATSAGVTVRAQPDGTDTIAIGGITLVQGTTASNLSVSTSGGATSIVATPGGVTVPVTSGQIAGVLQGINQYLPQYRGQLDDVAGALAHAVNTQLAAGYTASGVSGASEPLFVGSTAATLSLNPAVVADPTLIAAATTTGPAAANDGSNAQAMAELGNVPGGPDLSYQNLIQSLGATTQGVNAQVTSQTQVANQAQAALASATGVNLDSELTNLMGFQENYEASAKLLTTINQTMQSLLQAV